MAYLAVNQRVSASTQNQAFCAILFLSRYVLEKEMGDMRDNVRAKRPFRLPVVFSTAEVAKIISNIFSSMKKYTMIYTHVAQKKLAVVESPLDRLGESK